MFVSKRLPLDESMILSCYFVHLYLKKKSYSKQHQTEMSALKVKKGKRKKDIFHCEVCRKSMHKNGEHAHLNGQKHLIRMVQANLCEVPDGRYFCETCNTLKKEDEQTHVAGKQHQYRKKERDKIKRRAERLDRAKRLEFIKHQELVARRVIPIDTTEVSRERFQLIGNDTDYCAPEEIERAKGCQRVKDTGIGWEAFAALDINVESENDLLAPEDIQAASDQWDRRGLLYNIDTQWGSMPGGGAYKDSNRYDCSDEYDAFY